MKEIWDVDHTRAPVGAAVQSSSPCSSGHLGLEAELEGVQHLGDSSNIYFWVINSSFMIQLPTHHHVIMFGQSILLLYIPISYPMYCSYSWFFRVVHFISLVLAGFQYLWSFRIVTWTAIFKWCPQMGVVIRQVIPWLSITSILIVSRRHLENHLT